MTKKEWYENRILWRANRKNLFELGYQRFEDISSENQQIIRDMFGETQDVKLVLWDSDKRFTLVSLEELFCNYDGDIFRVMLDDIKEVRSDWRKSPKEIKMHTEYFFVNERKIWSGEGQLMMGLMNLLMMFPLNVPPQ